ncbi:MAG: amidohydrolase, partial [Acidimicrobiales bacterium]
MPEPITVFTARNIITMNPSVPAASAVAVKDSRILGVGEVDELSRWSRSTGSETIVDATFHEHVLTPGFVEAHSHVMSGGMWILPYVGFFDRRAPDGRLWPGSASIDEVVERLIEVEAELGDPGVPLVAWGLDPIYFPGERLIADHLDRVSQTRPIFVYHVSGHLATVNTALLERAEITAATPTPGVSKRADGTPDGELQEPAAMMLARDAYRSLGHAIRTPDAVWNYGYEARNAGHTLVTDLGTSQLIDPEQLAKWQRIVNDPVFPSRAMVAVSSMFGGGGTPEELASLGTELMAQATDKLRFGIVKLVLDGSIQGFTARISWPHYYQPPAGHPGNGLWLMAPEQMADIIEPYHRAGLTIHVHCNGDEATEVFVDAVEEVLARHPRPDHRHTVQHCQLTTPAQYRRMAALGMCANIFSNHIFYWGDQHRDITVGPDRAAGMDACATALRSGVPISIHSDTPVTP